MKIIDKVKKMINRKKQKVITIRRIENIGQFETKEELPMIFMDKLFTGYYSHSITDEEILFQLKRDALAKEFLKGLNY